MRGRLVVPSTLTHSCVKLRGCSGLPSAWVTERVAIRAYAEAQQLLCLTDPPSLQFIDGGRRQRHVPCPARLRFFVPDTGVSLFGALDNGHGCRGQIDITPPEGGDLAAPEATQHGKQRRNEHAGVAKAIEQRSRLHHVVGVHRLPFHLGRIDGVARIAGQHLSFHGLPERLFQYPVHVANGAGCEVVALLMKEAAN